jgi:hypothetical protein
MAIMMSQLRVLNGSAKDVMKAINVDEAWQAAKDMGLEDLNVYISPENPQEGMLVTRWASAKHAKKFQEKYEAAQKLRVKSEKLSFQTLGTPQLMVSAVKR